VRPEGEHEAVQVEKHDAWGARFWFPADHVLVESRGPFQISDTQCDETYSLLHKILLNEFGLMGCNAGGA
jgi:hypothetical protein